MLKHEQIQAAMKKQRQIDELNAQIRQALINGAIIEQKVFMQLEALNKEHHVLVKDLTDDDFAPMTEQQSTLTEADADKEAQKADHDMVVITSFAETLSQVYQQHNELATQVLEKHGVFSKDTVVRARQDEIMQGKPVALSEIEQKKAAEFNTALKTARLKLIPVMTEKSEQEKAAEEMAQFESQRFTDVVALSDSFNPMQRPELSMDLADDLAKVESLLKGQIINKLFEAVERMNPRQQQLAAAIFSSFQKPSANSKAVVLNALKNHYSIDNHAFPGVSQQPGMGWSTPVMNMDLPRSPLSVR